MIPDAVVIVSICVGAVVAMAAGWFDNRVRKRRQKREFARIAGENAGDGAEFPFRGYQVIASRQSEMAGFGDNRSRLSRTTVQLRMPETPRLYVGPRQTLVGWKPETASLDSLGVPEFDAKYAVFCDDERFARSMLTPDVQRWLNSRTFSSPLFLGDGVLSHNAPGELDAEVITKANMLVELARRMPLEVKPVPESVDPPRITPSTTERVLHVLAIVGLLPLLAFLLIIGVVALVNSSAYFVGMDGRVLANEPLISVLESKWYGPYPDFGTALQSFLLGFVLVGLPVLASVIGIIRVRKARAS